MATWIRTQGALALLAMSIGWALAALACGLLDEAQAWTVLFAGLNRFFLVMAIGSCALSLGIIACRSLPLRRTSCRSHCLHCVAGIVCVVLAARWVIISPAATYTGLMVTLATAGALLILDRRLPVQPTEESPPRLVRAWI